jgi:hypothetical protein
VTKKTDIAKHNVQQMAIELRQLMAERWDTAPDDETDWSATQRRDVKALLAAKGEQRGRYSVEYVAADGRRSRVDDRHIKRAPADYDRLAAKARELVSAWPEDRRVEWSERAAIRQFDGGYDRPQAEYYAYLDMRGTR